MCTPNEAQVWKNDIDAFKAEFGLRGGSVGTPYEIKPWMNEIDALRAEIEEGGGANQTPIQMTVQGSDGDGIMFDVFPSVTNGWLTYNYDQGVESGETLTIYGGKILIDGQEMDGAVLNVAGKMSGLLQRFTATGTDCTVEFDMQYVDFMNRGTMTVMVTGSNPSFTVKIENAKNPT